jgi:hypothetical protein
MAKSIPIMTPGKEIPNPDVYKDLVDVYSQEEAPVAEEVPTDPDAFYNQGEQIINPQ